MDIHMEMINISMYNVRLLNNRKQILGCCL